MDVKDFIVTPIYLLLLYLGAYVIRPYLTDRRTKPYFIPALTIRFVGAIMLGLIYQYYYGGGDTFTYFTHGSKYIWQAFLDRPLTGLQLIFGNNEYTPENAWYASHIYYFHDSPSYAVVRFSGFFGLLSFHTYSTIALFFAFLSFIGLWLLYRVFFHYYPDMHRQLAIAVFFVPSVFFWGSGIMKDSITIGALGIFVYSFFQIFIQRRRSLYYPILLFISFVLLFIIKIYILLCLFPAVMVWLSFEYSYRIKIPLLRWMTTPLVLTISLVAGYFLVQKIGEDNARYSLENLLTTAQVTAEYLERISILQGGSSYNLDNYDFSLAGMASNFVPAVWVTLFRPYIWEVTNPFMLLSALESTLFLLVTIALIIKLRFLRFFRILIDNPFLVFCLLFAISFSFAVGFSTYNFGSLVRYKIPMIPFYLSALVVLWRAARYNYKYEANNR